MQQNSGPGNRAFFFWLNGTCSAEARNHSVPTRIAFGYQDVTENSQA